MKCIIVDIDGTIADCRHRQHHVQGGKSNWKAFYEGISEDGVVTEIRDIIDTYVMWNELGPEHVQIIFCSGRPEDYKTQTLAWLTEHDVYFDELYMRPSGDFRPDHEVKSQMLDKILEDGYEPLFVIDDRPSVVKMWRERGLMCLQCNNTWGDDRDAGAPWGLLTIMVGPSGAGKSTWLYGENPVDTYSNIISSDELRRQFCGDFKDQFKNREVFKALRAIAKARLENGLPVTIDATNIRNKDRLACALLVPKDCPVRYIVIDRPLKEKLETGGWRLEVKDPKWGGKNLIEKHDQIFKSNLKDILRGDGLSNVTVTDLRAAPLR